MKIRSLLGIVFLVLGAAYSFKPPSCADHFFADKMPIVTNPALSKKTDTLCFESYAVMHSGISRTPIWVAEHLTRKSVEAAEDLKRKNAFHTEQALAPGDRAELNDYAGSGFDRGHMAPSGDMPTANAQYESFSLANMVPQNPNNNQNLWEGIETSTRALAHEEGELYVVTGPLFEGTSLQRLNGRVLVPTALFKAIYDPARKEAGAYVTPNERGMKYRTLSIAELEQRTGIDIFPGLSGEIKSAKMRLPVPTPHSSRNGRNKPVEVD